MAVTVKHLTREGSIVKITRVTVAGAACILKRLIFSPRGLSEAPTVLYLQALFPLKSQKSGGTTLLHCLLEL